MFVAAYLIALAAFSALSVLAAVPRPYDEYLALFTLGPGGAAGDYFPNGRADILPGTRVSWYVGVYNHMGGVQLLRIVFKLLNLTMVGPDELNNTPSKPQPFYEKTRLLTSNETFLFPAAWTVLNATESANGTEIHSLIFNGANMTDNVDVKALHGYNYRIVIELWVYDENAGDFTFAWTANGVEHSAWNQIWFNMTSISSLP